MSFSLKKGKLYIYVKIFPFMCCKIVEQKNKNSCKWHWLMMVKINNNRLTIVHYFLHHPRQFLQSETNVKSFFTSSKSVTSSAKIKVYWNKKNMLCFDKMNSIRCQGGSIFGKQNVRGSRKIKFNALYLGCSTCFYKTNSIRCQ